jgi:Tfp pilus assembly protein PilF
MRPLRHRGLYLGAILSSSLFVNACVLTGLAPVAETPLEPTVAVEPRKSETYLSLGTRLLVAREPELAIKAFNRSMNADGISPEALIGAGIAYQQQGLLSSARRYLEQASRLDPNSVVAHNNLGVVLFQLKEYHRARDEFRMAFAISNGASELAERNLNRIEATIAAIEVIPETDQSVSHGVVRLGGGEFRLVELAMPEADTMAE